MRVLPDENVDRKLKRLFHSELQVRPVQEHGWGGTKNGALLRLTELEFDVLLNRDANMHAKQHVAGFDFAVIQIVARSNKRTAVEPAMPDVTRLLRSVKPGRLYVISAF